MRPINVKTLSLEEFLEDQAPTYAIFFRSVVKGKIDKPGVGSVKFRQCCQQAKKDGFVYIWIDTSCIDKTDLVELSEAINSMFRWYQSASVCYAYPADVPADDEPGKDGSRFQASRWFQRGWTLQELRTKIQLSRVIEKITGISHPILRDINNPKSASVAQRKEDLAYCLLGIFGISMPMIYGEGGEQAFFRLQE
ncbi:heterokaryon incompatibility protein-domain-containing protein [Xylaria curta]|nr:heterokaryon incompatibility protein-domain-containing protein [Xylaria curta]